jgi:hypothetical protein
VLICILISLQIQTPAYGVLTVGKWGEDHHLAGRDVADHFDTDRTQVGVDHQARRSTQDRLFHLCLSAFVPCFGLGLFLVTQVRLSLFFLTRTESRIMAVEYTGAECCVHHRMEASSLSCNRCTGRAQGWHANAWPCSEEAKVEALSLEGLGEMTVF